MQFQHISETTVHTDHWGRGGMAEWLASPDWDRDAHWCAMKPRHKFQKLSHSVTFSY